MQSRTRAVPSHELPPVARLRQGRQLTPDRRGAMRLENVADALKGAGTIDEAEKRAADRWLRSYYLGVAETRTRDESGVRGSGGVAGYHAARLDALADYRAACAAVGKEGKTILYLTQVETMSLRGLAEKYGRNANVWAGIVATHLRRLAEHYSEHDRRPMEQAPAHIREADARAPRSPAAVWVTSPAYHPEHRAASSQ